MASANSWAAVSGMDRSGEAGLGASASAHQASDASASAVW